MSRDELLKKLNPLLDEYERNQTVGSIELHFNRGRCELIRRLISERFNDYPAREHNDDKFRRR